MMKTSDFEHEISWTKMGHMHAPELAATTSYHREPATPLLGSYLVEKATAGCKIDRFECCAVGGEGSTPQRVVKSRSDGGHNWRRKQISKNE